MQCRFTQYSECPALAQGGVNTRVTLWQYHCCVLCTISHLRKCCSTGQPVTYHGVCSPVLPCSRFNFIALCLLTRTAMFMVQFHCPFVWSPLPARMTTRCRNEVTEFSREHVLCACSLSLSLLRGMLLLVCFCFPYSVLVKREAGELEKRYDNISKRLVSHTQHLKVGEVLYLICNIVIVAYSS